jgi:Ferritin-like domain
LRQAASGGALALAAAALPARALARDGTGALATALRLQQLQAGLYSKAARAERISPDLLAFARAALEHERAHVVALRALIGPGAPAPPRIDLWPAAADDAAFAHRAIALADLAVASLNGLAGSLGPEGVITTARIAAVDARDAAWARALVGGTPAHRVRDDGRDAAWVEHALRRAGLGR